MNGKWWVLAAMCLLTVMLNIDVTALNIAIPVISQEFYAKLSDMQWVINAYVLLSAMLQILGGKLGDCYGHKKIFLIGTALFVLSSAGAGLSVDTEMLIAFRVLQGIALGIAYPMTIALTFSMFPKSQQAFALSFIVGTMGWSLALGPVIGGIFVETIGWRWIFYINVPLGILAYVLAQLFCKKEAEHQGKIDYRGSALLMVSLFALAFSFNQVQDWGFSSLLFWGLLAIGILFIYLLYLHERKGRNLMVDFKLFRERNFSFNNWIRLIVQLIFIPAIFFVPFYLQNIIGYSSLHSGIVMMAMTVAIGILSPLAGKWVDRCGDKMPNIVSMALFVVASLCFLWVGPDHSLWILVLALILIGIGVGIAFVSTTTGAVSLVPPQKQGIATGVIFTIGWFGCALGIAISGALLALKSQSVLLDSLRGKAISPDQLVLVERAARGIASVSELDSSLQPLATEAFSTGLHWAAFLWLILALVGLLLALFLKKPPTREKAHLDILVP